MYEYFKRYGYKTPLSETDNPYTFTNRTEGLDMWQFIAKEPYRREGFNLALQAQSRQSDWAIPIYPFEAEYKKI
jgi:hypothetical protein